MVTFEAVSLIAAHTGLHDDLTTAGTPYVLLKDISDNTLANLPLGIGTVDPVTGQLAFTWGTAPNGLLDGEAANCEVYDAGNVLYMTLTCVQSLTPVADACAMTTLDIVAGAPVSGVSFTIG